MGFWDGETCEYCSGPIVEKRVTLYRKVKGKYVVITHKCRKEKSPAQMW